MARQYGSMFTVGQAFTRPGDTTAYAVSDVVGPVTTPAVITFAGAARATGGTDGGTGYVVKARVAKNTNTTTNAAFRLYLYTTSVTPIADNVAWTHLYANRANLIGWVDFPTMTTEGTGSDCAEATLNDLRLPFVCAASGSALYGVLVARAAYTPGASDAFYVEITTEQN